MSSPAIFTMCASFIKQDILINELVQRCKSKLPEMCFLVALRREIRWQARLRARRFCEQVGGIKQQETKKMKPKTIRIVFALFCLFIET